MAEKVGVSQEDIAFVRSLEDCPDKPLHESMFVPFFASKIGEYRASAFEAGRQQGLREAAEALKPFARCADELDYEDKARSEYADEPFVTPDDEWAKFRLLVSDYRRAREAFAAITALMEGEGE